MVRDSAAAWFEVQVKDSLDAVTCVDGKRSKIQDLSLDHLLAVLDKVEGTSSPEPTRSQV